MTTRVEVPADVVKRLNKLRKKMENDPDFHEVEITLDNGVVLVLKNE
jgi:hypothetical protein